MAAAVDDVGQGGADRAPLPEQVDLHGALEVGGVDRAHGGGRRRHARVGHEHFDAAHRVAHPGDGGVQRLRVADVGLHADGPGAELVREALRADPVDVEDRHGRAAGVGDPRGRRADPLGRPGDHDGAAGEGQAGASGHVVLLGGGAGRSRR